MKARGFHKDYMCTRVLYHIFELNSIEIRQFTRIFHKIRHLYFKIRLRKYNQGIIFVKQTIVSRETTRCYYPIS